MVLPLTEGREAGGGANPGGGLQIRGSVPHAQLEIPGQYSNGDVKGQLAAQSVGHVTQLGVMSRSLPLGIEFTLKNGHVGVSGWLSQ